MDQFLVALFLNFLIVMADTGSSDCTLHMHEDGVLADCTRRQMTSPPSTWPLEIVSLNMSHNQMLVITGLAHHSLANLRHLDLTYNQLVTIDNDTFVSLQKLEWLSLQGNYLQQLQAGTFNGLGKLRFLDVSHNRLQLDPDTYPPGVFAPLSSLWELWLNGNDNRHDGKYPDQIFQPLSTLRVLSLDTFMDSQFGPGFKALTNLISLRLDENGKLKYLRNETLRVFHNSSLEELRIRSKALVRVETCAFCFLPSLKRLHLNDATVPLTSAMMALYGLQHQQMAVIDFSGVHILYTTDVDMQTMIYVRTICVTRLNLANTNIQRFSNSAAFVEHTPLARCLQEIDLSRNRLVGDVMAIFVSLLYLKNLTSFRMDSQNINSIRQAGCLLGQNSSCTTKIGNYRLSFEIPPAPKLQYLNISAGLRKMDKLPSRINFTFVHNLKTLDISYCLLSTCQTTFYGMNNLETLDISGNYCYNISDTFFDFFTSLRHLRLANFNVNPDLFRQRARRMFKNLQLLETLDLSDNNLLHVDRNMLQAQRQLRELNLAGNRLQSVSVDLTLHEGLVLLDASNNMLPTLLVDEMQALDSLAARHGIALRLGGNPLLCACSNLDFVRWVWVTAVHLDGEEGLAGNYTCVTDTGEVSDTHRVMQEYDFHWRRCHGQSLLGIASAAFLLQLLALVMVYVVSRSWTHIVYMWKVMKKLNLPRREHFRRDAYVGYADADWMLACRTLPVCLQERHDVRLLLRDREELPGSVRAESIVEHIDDSWKVLLLVTRAFAMDEWACGFTVQQAQRSITDTMPDRVIVVFLEDPGCLPPMASLERLLRMVPERNVLHVHRDTPPGHPVWDRLAEHILQDN